MSFKRQFFIKIVFFCCYVFPSASFSGEKGLAKVFKDLTCVKDVNHYYPFFLKGQLDLAQQDRFFNCLAGFLDAVVNKKIITHTPERDHFTRHEIFKMFHILFEYEEERSKKLTNQLLFFKKLLIGGSIDAIKDQELSHLFNLVFDYKEAYYIIHKEIPIFKKLFKGESIDSQRADKALEQLRKTALLLSRAYQKEKIVYTIADLSKYPQYMEQDSGDGDLNLKALFFILQNVFEGTLFPQKEIEGKGWPVFVNVIYRSFDFLFYYNRSLLKELTEIQFAYNSLSALEKLLPILASNEDLFLERGFPIRNLDNILQASLDFFIPQQVDSFLSHLKDEKRLRFLTRTFFALSLDPVNAKPLAEATTNETASAEVAGDEATPAHKSAGSDWKTGSSLVTVSFPDSKFHFFEDHFTEEKLARDYFISTGKIKKIEEWIKDYKSGLLNIYNGFEEELAVEKGMSHWLDIFFGWDENNQMIYGSFERSDNSSKMMRLLSYQAFLSLLLFHYVPDEYFESEEQELSFKQWHLILSDLTPFFYVAFGSDEFQKSWKSSLKELFTVADLFLNSSNLSEGLNRKELLDLFIHLMSALKQSQKVFPQLVSLCEKESDFSSCAVQSLLNESEMLNAYPRFKDYIFPVKREKYERYIQPLLSGLDRKESEIQLLKFFFLIQVIEVNYYQRINTNQSFNLESEELLVFANSFKEKIFLSIPYLFNSDQALAYILYSFQSKEIPFFTGSDFESIRFTHWYLNPQVRSSFSITPGDFHKLAFEFYNLYNRF